MTILILPGPGDRIARAGENLMGDGLGRMPVFGKAAVPEARLRASMPAGAAL